jgi:hypothetical protein
MDIPITSAVDFIQSSFHTLASQAGQTNNRVAPIFPASFLRQGEIEHRVSHCSLRASSKHFLKKTRARGMRLKKYTLCTTLL